MAVSTTFGLQIRGSLKRKFEWNKLAMKTMDAAKKALIRQAAYIRRVARSSMQKADKPSAPGKPPHAHDNPLIRKLLYFDYDDSTGSVVVGPISGRRRSEQTVPELMEYGGTVQRPGQNARTYPPRPYMQPAFEKSSTPTMMSKFWLQAFEGKDYQAASD